MNESKLCTILIPTYNMEKYIDRTLNSVFKNKEWFKYANILVIDDGSTDNTVELVKKYLKEYPNNIELFQKPNGNWGSVINYAKNNKLIKTKYMSILDADDLIAPKFIKYLNYYADKEDFDIGFYKTKVIWKRNFSVVIHPKMFLKNLNDDFYPVLIPCSTVFKTEVFYQIDDLAEKVSYQDYAMFYKIITKSKKHLLIPKLGATYWYSRPNNTMTSSWDDKRFNGEKVLLNELKKLGKEYLFAARVILPGYVAGISSINGCINVNKDHYNMIMNQSSKFFKWLLKLNIKRAQAHNSINITDGNTELVLL
ncbi:Hyaluronan synthase [Mycoplasmopsis bovigenitalium]|uniref:Hyaluronan synthase n=1 Tax=Mycoplasmopsis bovigenitalium TaxID=2112 RepID=A0A449AA23_9BACT|nr:glycosyltransferase family A protein [Mycoplasmopsis bovigenitalium]VEU61125.1 Hyaluronan synthase [Mycoplasmopsis bovigenitalium]